MSLPTGKVTGDLQLFNGVTYVYNGTDNTWSPVSSANTLTVGALTSTSLTSNSTLAVTGASTLTGNVGIGIASPVGKLDVVDTNCIVYSRGSNGYGSFYAVGSGTNTSYMFFGNATNGEQSRIASANGGSVYFQNGSGATTRLMIDSNGYVGINTNSMIRKFQVNGDATNNVGNVEMSLTTTATNGSAFINVSDTTGSNGTGYNLYMRGLGSSGTASLNLASFNVSAVKTNFTGSITASAQPNIRLNGNNSASFNFAGSTQVLTSTYYSQDFATGISWNSSTGKVTVPTAGYYFITLQVYVIIAENANGRIALYQNGAAKQLMHTGLAIDGTYTMSLFLYAAANDYFEVVVDNFDPIRMYMGAIHTTFHMFLHS